MHSGLLARGRLRASPSSRGGNTRARVVRARINHRASDVGKPKQTFGVGVGDEPRGPEISCNCFDKLLSLSPNGGSEKGDPEKKSLLSDSTGTSY